MVFKRRDMDLNCGMRCVKFMILFVTLMFSITAILLMIVGTTVQIVFGDFRVFLTDNFMSPPNLLIATGFLMLFVAFVGTYGVIKESVMMINVYGLLLFLIFILEVAAAITAFVMHGQIHDMLTETMHLKFAEYNHSVYITSTIDFMQTELGCCGVDDPSDWKDWKDWKEDCSKLLQPNNYTANDICVPDSCCERYADFDLRDCQQLHETGCLPVMTFIISQSTMLIVTGATTVAIVQLICSLCAFMLAKELRRNKSRREARRWQLQQSLDVIISAGKMEPPINSLNGYTQLTKSEHLNEQDPITYTPNSPSVN